MEGHSNQTLTSLLEKNTQDQESCTHDFQKIKYFFKLFKKKNLHL